MAGLSPRLSMVRRVHRERPRTAHPGMAAGSGVMSDQDAFERILASLYDAMLDTAQWQKTSALIDEACGTRGNALGIGEGPKDDIRLISAGLYYRGERREDLEREYLERYHPIDECVPRFRQLSDSHLVHITDLYTAEELKTSPTYNELMAWASGQDSLHVRLDGPDDSYIAWAIADPVTPGGWGFSQIMMIKGLLPHIRQFVRVQQALVRAGAQGTSCIEMLDNPRVGVIHLDQRGQIMAANDRAQAILRHGDGIMDRAGVLRARVSADRARLERLVADALPAAGAVAVSGSMLLRRTAMLPSFVVHLKPVSIPQPDFGARRVAVLVLITEPRHVSCIDPGLVATTLGLTPVESQIATWLAEGKTVREIAEAMERQERSIYWHLQQIYDKQGISRQVDLVRLVLSIVELA